MSAERKTITDLTCKNAKARESKYEIADATRIGFRLSVQPSGAKSLILRYTAPDGTWSNMILAKYTPDTNALAIALDAYRNAQDALARKVDPKVALKPQHDDNATVTAHVTRYKAAKAPDWSPGTAYNVGIELDYLTDAIGSKAMRDVTRQDVQKVIDAAGKRGKDGKSTPHAQVSSWKWIGAFFAWVYGRDEIPSNPVEKIERPRKDTMRKRKLTDAEIKIVWSAAETAGGPPGNLVKLLLLTGMRRTEATHLTWKEVGDDCIRLAGSRTKNGEPHTIPITPMIKRVLDGIERKGKFVLGSGDCSEGLGGHTKAKRKIKTPDLEEWTYHDLRRTFANGLARLGVALAVTELALNHKSGTTADPLVQIYQDFNYTKEVKAAFELWSAHVEGLLSTDGEKLAA